MEENNKLIAEFMGVPTEVFNTGILNYGIDESWYELHELSYNISWDWLIPVIEKIESLYHRTLMKTDEGQHFFEIWCYDDEGIIAKEIQVIEPEDSPTKIGCAYLGVLEFIKWYNENK